MLSKKMYATSTYTLDNIEYRLATLHDMGRRPDAGEEAERQREIGYLEELLQRKFSAQPAERAGGDQQS